MSFTYTIPEHTSSKTSSLHFHFGGSATIVSIDYNVQLLNDSSLANSEDILVAVQLPS